MGLHYLVKIGKMDVFLRPMGVEDIPQVVEIEREAFPTLGHSTPFRRELNSRLASYLVACAPNATRISLPQPSSNVALTAGCKGPVHGLMRSLREVFTGKRSSEEAAETILGYVGLWFTGREAHITAIAVREAMRRTGIGELLMMGSLEITLSRNCQALTLEVRASNDVAQSLYLKYGLIQVGMRKGYYVDNREDAVIMSSEPLGSLALTERLRQMKEAYVLRRGEIRMMLAA